MKKITVVGIFILAVSIIWVIASYIIRTQDEQAVLSPVTDSTWLGPSLYVDNRFQGEERDLIIYGEELIAHTSRYLGPKGSVAQITNGMNCQNCHLQGGNKPWGNNYGAVYATYPKYRDRSGQKESIYKRVADCMERSLNGTAIDSNSKEFKAIYAYLQWLGKDVPKGKKPHGTGIEKLDYLPRAADPEKGKIVYVQHCQSCHGPDGQGQLSLDESEYTYPPLWGNSSYNDGAGLYRLSNFAGYVKTNMPYLTASRQNPVLTDEECWDVAAYINSKPRPHKDQKEDWPYRTKKPIDFAFGPYADSFTEKQHKYGPFTPIQRFYSH
jgi:thiosulfate dehydrogenase